LADNVIVTELVEMFVHFGQFRIGELFFSECGRIVLDFFFFAAPTKFLSGTFHTIPKWPQLCVRSCDANHTTLRMTYRDY
jgi:hypothetical protein